MHDLVYLLCKITIVYNEILFFKITCTVSTQNQQQPPITRTLRSPWSGPQLLLDRCGAKAAEPLFLGRTLALSKIPPLYAPDE